MSKEIKRLLEEIYALQKRNSFLQVETYLQSYLYHHPKYQDPKRLARYEYHGFAQHGEDGIIGEIFRRIGTTSRFFVEFGCGKHGIENNTVFLLLQGWKGCWFEWNPVHVKRIAERFRPLIDQKILSVHSAFITAENINEIFAKHNIPKECDLLSIDVDGNDYWIWKALESFSPRVVVIEYNAIFPPPMKWVMKYNPQHRWDGTSHFGVSLKSLELLGRKKGYNLVACDFTGANAFFVREDVCGDHFLSPFTAENHYEPPRYFLERHQGHPRSFGEFEAV